MRDVVLDASVALAMAFGETGSETARAAVGRGYIGAVNFSETIAKVWARGGARADGAELLFALPWSVVPFDAELAQLTAELIPHTRPFGLGLADRACLALGKRLGLPVLTADRAWGALRIGVKVQLLR